MKKLWTKLIIFCTTICTLVGLLCLSSCAAPQKQADGTVVHREAGLLMIRIDSADEGATLKDAMTKMQTDGEIAFEEDGTGMILSVDGYAASGSGWWGLYTTDEEFDMGYPAYNFTYQEETYFFSSLGHALLPVAVGETYVWHYVG